ncbi:protein FAR1-RELATED SEQUENCE 5-like [Silene latifolia]|uniref:protein FAR1-RELATED SEQUENCE 5-like n=1 Tax=Silene latifolia TaxID=37657 RepID=UPI003D771262
MAFSGYSSMAYGATINFNVDGKGIHQGPRETTLLGNHTLQRSLNSNDQTLTMIDNNVDNQTTMNSEEKKKRKRSVEPKKTKITRFGCKAKIRFCAVFNDLKELIGYAIDTFYEGHNHRLCSLKEREFQKNVRTLNLYMKQTIVNNCENDADMILDYLKALSQSQDGFYYAYQVDEDNCLAKLFWADAQARMNYSLFGDTITFDPTYGTNKYRMAFTPFTLVLTTTKIGDFSSLHLSIMRTMGHSFGCLRSSLIVWATRNLDAFLPIKIRQLNSGCVTYSSKQDIARMWHIMKKLTDKVESQICKETDFVERICGVVWDTDLEPIEFEEKWTQVINDFELNDNTWLTYMYGKRHKWIPA